MKDSNFLGLEMNKKVYKLKWFPRKDSSVNCFCSDVIFEVVILCSLSVDVLMVFFSRNQRICKWLIVFQGWISAPKPLTVFCALSRHFISTDATSNFGPIVSSYPGALVLVTIQVKIYFKFDKSLFMVYIINCSKILFCSIFSWCSVPQSRFQ